MLLPAILLTVQFTPLFAGSAELDISFRMCRHYAFAHDFQAGKEYLGTYGPWGFADDSFYDPQTFAWLLFSQAIIGLGLFAGVWGIGRQLGFHPLLCGAWVLLVGVWGDLLYNDGVLCVMCLLPILIRLTSRSGRDHPGVKIVVIALAMAGLSKFTFLVAGAASVAFLSVDDIVHRRLPRLALWYAVAVLVFWRLAGQPFSGIPFYLWSAFNLASGYSSAMGHPGHDSFMVPLFCILSGIAAFLLAARFHDKSRWTVLTLLVTVLMICFFNFKEGFVRHDGHEILATTGLAALVMLAAPILWTIAGVPNRRRNQFRVLAVVLIGLSVGCVDCTYHAFFKPRRLQIDLVKEGPKLWTRAVSAGRWLWQGDRIYDQTNRNVMALVRKENPLPLVSGSVDMYGLNQLAVIDAGLDYRPKPVTPGYHAWTPQLIAINRASLWGPRAPDNIFLKPDPIDQRFPTMDNGALWPSVLSAYDIVGLTPTDFAVLRRRPVPRPGTMTFISAGRYRFDQAIPVPVTKTGAIWVQMKITPTLMGRVGTALYRSPSIWLKFTTANGTEGENLIIPGMCEDGFVLSPYITDVGGFLALAAHSSHMPDVTSIAITVHDTHHPAWWYQPIIQVMFKRFVPPRQDLRAYPAPERARRAGGNGAVQHRSLHRPVRLPGARWENGPVFTSAHPSSVVRSIRRRLGTL